MSAQEIPVLARAAAESFRRDLHSMRARADAIQTRIAPMAGLCEEVCALPVSAPASSLGPTPGSQIRILRLMPTHFARRTARPQRAAHG